MIRLEHVLHINGWRWKPALYPATRSVVYPWPMKMKAWGLRWGFWLINFYSDKPL